MRSNGTFPPPLVCCAMPILCQLLYTRTGTVAATIPGGDYQSAKVLTLIRRIPWKSSLIIYTSIRKILAVVLVG